MPPDYSVAFGPKGAMAVRTKRSATNVRPGPYPLPRTDGPSRKPLLRGRYAFLPSGPLRKVARKLRSSPDRLF